MKLSSVPLRHTQRINTSFRLVITNQQSPDSGDFVARKFLCKVTRPFSSHPNIKEEKAVWLRETIGHIAKPSQLPIKISTFNKTKQMKYRKENLILFKASNQSI